MREEELTEMPAPAGIPATILFGDVHLRTRSHLLQKPGRESDRIETDRIPDLEAGNPVFGSDLVHLTLGTIQ